MCHKDRSKSSHFPPPSAASLPAGDAEKVRGRPFGEGAPTHPLTRLISDLDCRAQYDSALERLVATHSNALVARQRAEFREQVEEDEILSELYSVLRAILDSANPPTFTTEREAVSYFGIGLRNRILAIVMPRGGVARNSVSIEATDAYGNGPGLSDTLTAHRFGAMPADEWFDIRMGVEWGELSEPENRRCVLVRFLMRGLGYTVEELRDPRLLITELCDAQVRHEIERHLGRVMIDFIDNSLAALAKVRSSGSIGNDSSTGKKLLARRCDRTPKADVRRTRARRTA